MFMGGGHADLVGPKSSPDDREPRDDSAGKSDRLGSRPTGAAACRHCTICGCTGHHESRMRSAALDPLWAILSALEKRHGEVSTSSLTPREIEGMLDRYAS